MSRQTANIEYNFGVIQDEKSDKLTEVLSINRTAQIRNEIGIIADRSYREKVISAEAYTGYKKLEHGQEEKKFGLGMLESTREFAKHHEEKAIRVHNKIHMAIVSKFASVTDEAFLMEKLVIGNIKFLEGAAEVEFLIDEKLGRMKKDREAYDNIMNHKLVKNIGYLKLNVTDKIKIPDEKAFLAMTVPERREMIKQVQAALPKAEKYAENVSEGDVNKLKARYDSKLKSALEQKIIGLSTYRKFLNGFSVVDAEEKEYWIEEFEAQMERYRELWKNIRGALRGPALAGMEAMRDKMGYTELFTEFGKVQKAECLNLSKNYAALLKNYQSQGIIGRHTVSKFNIWMTHQNLTSGYSAIDRLDNEMNRYRELWKEIEALKEEDQTELRSKIDILGYTELRREYERMNNEVSGSYEFTDVILRKVEGASVRKAFQETDDMLGKGRGSKKTAFIGLLSKMFAGRSSDKFDANDFQSKVRQKSAQEKVTGVVEDSTFIQLESIDGENIHRNTKVMINDLKSMQYLATENAKHAYRPETAGGTDDLSLSVGSDDGKIIEMNLKEIRLLESYLKAQSGEK